jgi:hypothetical protein
MKQLAAYVQGRIDRVEKQLESARESFRKTKHESWGGRVAELAGRLEELQAVQCKIQSIEAFNF